MTPPFRGPIQACHAPSTPHHCLARSYKVVARDGESGPPRLNRVDTPAGWTTSDGWRQRRAGEVWKVHIHDVWLEQPMVAGPPSGRIAEPVPLDRGRRRDVDGPPRLYGPHHLASAVARGLPS